MNQLIPTHRDGDGNILVSGRDLHEFLESGERYSKWFERMTEYGFSEGIDYTPYQKVHPQNNQELQDHAMSIDMAKEISMLQRNEKGKKARQYFIEVEKSYTLHVQLPQTPMQALELMFKAQKQTDQEVEHISKDVAVLKDTMRISGAEQFKINEFGKRKVLQVLGGKEAHAYEVLSKKVFAQLWRDFKKHFVIPRYSELPHIKVNEAMKFINYWQPDTEVRLAIDEANQQIEMI